MNWALAYQFAKDHGLPYIMVLVILALFLLIVYLLRQLLDENRSALLRAKIYKCLLYFSKRCEHEKKYISNDIMGRVNLARNRIHYGSTILPKAVRVDWVNGSDPEAYEVAEGKFVVRLDPASQQEQNIVCLTQILVKRTSLLGIRHLIEEPLCKAFDITLIRRLLYETKVISALNWFYTNMLQPILKTGGALANWNTKVVEIDEQGLFDKLLLVELEDFSKRVAGMEPRPYMMGEVEHLVNFVHRIATKEEWVDTKLEYIKAFLQVGIVLVARAETILEKGIEPYLKSAQGKAHRVKTLYLIIWGKKHLRNSRPDDYIKYLSICNKLAKEIGRLPGVCKNFEVVSYNYIDPKGRRRKGRLVRYIINSEKSIS
jgi:hypothetical protein